MSSEGSSEGRVVCPKCLNDSAELVAPYTQKETMEHSGTAIAWFDPDDGEIAYDAVVDYQREHSEQYDEEEEEIDEDAAQYRCCDCKYQTYDYEEFNGGNADE